MTTIPFLAGTVGLSLTCLVAAVATAAAERERTLGRLRLQDPERLSVPKGENVHAFGSLSLKQLAGAAIGAAAGFWLAGPVGAVAGIVMSAVVRRSARVRNADRTSRLLDEQLGDAMSTLSAAVRAGLSVRRALEEAHRGSDPPLRDALAEVLAELRVGQPIDISLERFAAAINSPDASLLATLLSVHRRTGGDLPALLDEVAEVANQRAESRRQFRALTAQGRASGAVLTVLPIAFVGLLSGTSGDGLGAFYRSPAGGGLLLAGLLFELLGFAWISRIVRGSELA